MSPSRPRRQSAGEQKDLVVATDGDRQEQSGSSGSQEKKRERDRKKLDVGRHAITTRAIIPPRPRKQMKKKEKRPRDMENF